LYNSGSGDSTPDTNGLIAHYNFEQTGDLESQTTVIGSTISDTSTNGITINYVTPVSFGAGSFTSTGSGTTIVNDIIEIRNPTGTLGHVSVPLSSATNDFILNFEYTQNSGSAGNGENIYMASGTLGFWDSGQTSLQFAQYNGYTYFTAWENGGYVGYANNSSMSFTDGTKYYATMECASNTCTLNFYTDAGRTSSYGSQLSMTFSGTMAFTHLNIGAHSDSGAKNADVPISSVSVFDGTGNPLVASISGTDSTIGVIGTSLNNPDLTYTDSTLPSGTNPFSIGGWVSIDEPPTYASKVTAISDLLAYYNFEQTGTTLTDQASNLGDGISNGGVTTGITGVYGNGWSFDGSNDQIDLPSTEKSFRQNWNKSRIRTPNYWRKLIFLSRDKPPISTTIKLLITFLQ
jgi:hypothetical protein